ncbi:MAG: hypothetical protein JWO84_375 [Parcubacteria group bacterium]|nr:hypothetical protein [Parcubacteria group bacterium]
METQRVHEVVRSLRDKPLHVRENIAIGVSGGITLLVALGWFAASAASGTFSLSPNATLAATNNPEMQQAVNSSKDGFSQLLGAASASIGASSSPATITVVDTQVHSTLDQQTVPADQTVIHF